MASASYVQSSFLGGVWSPFMQGRMDDTNYKSAMNVCLNGLPVETGAWVRRPGTRLGAHTRGGLPGRALPFDFKETAPYTIELTDGYLRFFNNYTLVTTNDANTVSSISSASPAEITTGSAHGWSTGDTVVFGGLGTLCPLLQNRQFLITSTASNKFTIVDAITNTAIDGSTLGWSVPGDAPSVKRVMEIISPYIGGNWSSVRMIQAEEKALMLNGTISPRMLKVESEPTANEYAEFAISEADFHDGPYLDPFKSTQITPSATNGLVNCTLSFPAYDSTKAYSVGDFVTSSNVNYRSLTSNNVNNTPASTVGTSWEVVSADSEIDGGLQATDIGRHVRIFSEPSLWRFGVSYAANDKVKYNDAYWYCLASTSSAVPGQDATKWAAMSGATAAVWTWGKITALLNMIDRALSGSTNIGTMTNGAGVAAAFDANTAKLSINCARKENILTNVYVGKNYSGATAQQISSTTVWPSTDLGFAYGTYNPGDGPRTISNWTVTFNLRAKASSPSSSSDGTLLGSEAISYTASAGYVLPVTIQSNDTTTTWNYVWIEVVATPSGYSDGSSLSTILSLSQVQFFKPATAGGNGFTLQIRGDALLYTVAALTWRMGLFSTTTGWPKCGTYHEGRVWFSGAVDNRIDSSKSNGFSDNGVIDCAPTRPDGTVTDANAISYVFNAPDVNAIFWMYSDEQGIVCGTQAGEWVVRASANNNPLTPTSIQAHRHTRVGCYNAEPKRTGLTYVFIQKFKHKLMEYFADVFSGRFLAPNLSKAAKHLTVNDLEEIAFQQELSPIVWGRCGDGTLIGATYKRESLVAAQPPSFIGWHNHTLGSEREVESICVGPNVDGTLDSLSMVTNDPDADIEVRHVEILTDLPNESADLLTCWQVDSGIVPTSMEVATVSGRTCLVLYGLWPHNGKTVDVWGGGLDLGSFAVSNGSCTIPFGTVPSFTQAYYETFDTFPVIVGFTFTSRGQTLRPATPADTGARTGPGFGKFRRSHILMTLLDSTKGISFGTRFGKLKPALFKTAGGTAYGDLELFSGIYRYSLEDDYGYDSMLAWEVTRPYPANVLAIGPLIETQDA